MSRRTVTSSYVVVDTPSSVAVVVGEAPHIRTALAQAATKEEVRSVQQQNTAFIQKVLPPTALQPLHTQPQYQKITVCADVLSAICVILSASFAVCSVMCAVRTIL